jgi:hypothetical protein
MIDLADKLRADIRHVCLAADSLRGNPPGSAERGIYYWLWDPDLSYLTDISVLLRLRLDAVRFLSETVGEFEFDLMKVG